VQVPEPHTHTHTHTGLIHTTEHQIKVQELRTINDEAQQKLNKETKLTLINSTGRIITLNY